MAHDIDAGGAFGQSFEQRRQALTAFVSLRIMLDVLVRIDDGDRYLIASFDAFELCKVGPFYLRSRITTLQFVQLTTKLSREPPHRGDESAGAPG